MKEREEEKKRTEDEENVLTTAAARQTYYKMNITEGKVVNINFISFRFFSLSLRQFFVHLSPLLFRHRQTREKKYMDRAKMTMMMMYLLSI